MPRTTMLRTVPRILLLLAVALLVAACTGDNTAAPSPDPTVEPTVEPAPAPEPAPLLGDEDLAEGTDPLTLALPPGRTGETAVPGDPALLALGDSIAAGTGLEDLGDGFVWRVHRALEDGRDGPYGLVNASVPGATSGSLLEGPQRRAAEQALETRKVDTVLVSVGGNDLLALLRGACAGSLGTPACQRAIDEAVEAFSGNLAVLLDDLDEAAASDARLVVLRVYNPLDLGMRSQVELQAAAATAALNAAIDEVARDRDVVVADGFAALEGQISAGTGMGASLPDIHPTAFGHDRLAIAVLDALEEDAGG